jgi:hypothetical protein
MRHTDEFYQCLNCPVWAHRQVAELFHIVDRVFIDQFVASSDEDRARCREATLDAIRDATEPYVSFQA